MDIQIDRKSTRNLYETPLLHQTSFWSEVKNTQGIESKAFDIKVRASDIGREKDQATYLVDDVLILLMDIGRQASIGYIPYGPALMPDEDQQGRFLEELSESLRTQLPSGCIMLRYDLPWESLWAKEEDFTDEGEWMGPPQTPLQELRLNYGTNSRNLRKAYTDILPTDTAIIDLKRSEEELRMAMKPKTRYNIALAYRKGVWIREGSYADLPLFYELYQQTSVRNGIYLHDISNFDAMFRAGAIISENADIHTDFKLLIAGIDDMPLAAMFLVFSGSSATYLYGASSSSNRNSMATYALQWEAIRMARGHGCTQYDLFGTAPKPDPSHPLYGLYRFKMGFGGEQFHRMGCWDFPLKPDEYSRFVNTEMVSQGYHIR